MTNHTDVTPADLAPRSHADQARHHLVQAHKHGRRAGDALEAGEHQQVGIHAGRQRLQLKYAEVNAALALVDELAKLVQSPEPSPAPVFDRTFVIARTVQRAHHWCRDNDIAPRARSTYVLTTPDSVRGLTIHSEDVVHIIDDLEPAMAESLSIAYLSGERDLDELHRWMVR